MRKTLLKSLALRRCKEPPSPFVNKEEYKLFSIFRNKTPKTTIVKTATGRWGVFKGETLVKDYSRKTDAFRGATRAGLTVEGVRD